MIREIIGEHFVGERPLFGERELKVADCVFSDGESPLKECSDIELVGSLFHWKYPLWYCKNISAKNCTLFEMARAGMWYTDNISFEDCVIDAPKSFRRANGITLRNVDMPNAAETLWQCGGITLENVTARGDYFAMNSRGITVNGFTLSGNYGFDGCADVEIRGAKMLTKDAFWNCRNVTVYDSFIAGEYFGWNAQNLTLVNCTIESLQGLCYIDNLVMKNCRLINTTLAFEYSTVEADIIGGIDSVFNPTSGHITADFIRELVVDKDKVDPTKTVIVCRGKA